jgi:hypothetical protein
MRGDVTIKGKKAYKLRLTLGAMEDIPADDSSSPPVPFLPANVLNQLATNIYSARDVRVVVEAGISGAGLNVSYDQIVEDAGFQAAATGARKLLMSFFGIESSGKADAAPEKATKEEAAAS